MRPVTSSHVVNISDLRSAAKRRLPRVIFDYLDGGAEGEVTLRENCRIFDDVTFRSWHAVSHSSCDLGTTVLGHKISLPLMLAPVGYSRLMHPGGEVAAARAAEKAGTGYIQSTNVVLADIDSPENIRALRGRRLDETNRDRPKQRWYFLAAAAEGKNRQELVPVFRAAYFAK